MNGSPSPVSPPASETHPASAWGPLQYPVFRWLWLAAIASNIGTWMQEAGAGWLMTLLSSDPLMVALVQAAGAAPMFLLALPAGALSDIVDRRRYLLVLQGWMAGVALTLALLTWSGGITPAGLLGLTRYENMSERALSSEPVNIETCHPLIEAILMTW